MTSLRHSASPAVSGIDGAVSPGVQAGPPRTSPSKVGASELTGGGIASLNGWPSSSGTHDGSDGCGSMEKCRCNSGDADGRERPASDFALGGVDSVCPTRASSLWATEAKDTTEAMRATARASAISRCNSGPSAPFNDCGGESVEITATPRLRPSARGGYKQEAERLEPASVANPQGVSVGHRNASAPQSPICPELTAYITVLLTVIGAVAWAHVYSMTTTLEGELTHFHPRVMICDAVGNRAEKLCAVRHKGAE